jgi:hypothetical protein
MLRTFLVAALVCLLGLGNLNAKILRFGFAGKAVAGVDFTDVTQAVTAAAAGDTIQVYQYNAITNTIFSVNKRLVFLGFGYMLDKNPLLQVTPVSDYATGFYLLPGADGTIIEGLNINSTYIAANDITFKRCRITTTFYVGYNANNGQQPSISNLNIFGNYFTSFQNFQDFGQVSNLLFSNNFVDGFNSTVTLDNSSGILTNNIIHRTALNLSSFVVKNNIFTTYCITSAGSIYQNNLFNVASCANITGNGNQFGINMNDIFSNWNNGSITSDNQLTLKAGSPAINAGTTGTGSPTDAGVFGGGDNDLAYRLSGIPAIPSINVLTSSSQTATTNPYTITVSIKSNN